MVANLIHKIVAPKSSGKDKARQEFILNVLLVGSFLLTFFAFCIVIFARYTNSSVEGGLAPVVVCIFLIFLNCLYWLSRKGYVRLSALLLVTSFYLICFYTFFKWGTDVTQAWLTYALLIVMSGVLIGTRFAFFVTLSLVIAISFLSQIQLAGLYEVGRSWRDEPYTFADTILLNITLVVISIIAWLSNRETEKSLKRARASEAELKRERDLLEIKVEERTKELKKAQLEKITQLYRFAEIGKLSSSLFHDLVTPLSLISMNLEELKNKREQTRINDMQALVKRAIQGTKFLESFVLVVRQQLQNQELKKVFSLNKEIKQVIQMVQYKINSEHIKIIFESSGEIRTYGNYIKFSQLITNLVLNAIDAYDHLTDTTKREIQIKLYEQNNVIYCSVTDFGKGINKEDITKIFQPFFTTKSVEKGTGIGLSISRDIVEKSFQGKISVKSSQKSGTVFTIHFPKNITARQKSYALLKKTK